MAYPKKTKKRALNLALKGHSAEKIAEILSKDVQKGKLDKSPDARTIRRWLSELREETRVTAILPDALIKHNADLMKILKGLETQAHEISEKSPLVILRDAMHYMTKELQEGSKPPPLNERWEYKDVCKFEWTDGHVTVFWLTVEEDPSFKYLRQHLAGQSVWRQYVKWKELMQQHLDIYYSWERKDESTYGLVSKMSSDLAECSSDMMAQLLQVRLKGILPGRCDTCPG